MLKVTVIALLLHTDAALGSVQESLVIHTGVLDHHAAGVLQRLRDRGDNRFEFLSGEPEEGAHAQISVDPKHEAELKTILDEEAQVAYFVKVADWNDFDLPEQGASSVQSWPDLVTDWSAGSRPRMHWDDYQNYETINGYLDELAKKHLDFVRVVNIGPSFEGRQMKVLRVGKAGERAPNVWIEGGIHAREWISPAVVTYLIRELVENPVKYAKYVERVNQHFLPLANPDGYQFSREHNYVRMRGEDHDEQCDVCSLIYPGPEPFSEVEARNIRDYVLSLSPAPTYANSYHSFGNMILFPFGFQKGFAPHNYDEMKELGDAMAEAIRNVHGTRFIVKQASDIYEASGMSTDWYRLVAGVRLVYATELRHGESMLGITKEDLLALEPFNASQTEIEQNFGFLLPPEEILPTGEEIWAAHAVALDKVVELSEEGDQPAMPGLAEIATVNRTEVPKCLVITERNGGANIVGDATARLMLGVLSLIRLLTKMTELK